MKTRQLMNTLVLACACFSIGANAASALSSNSQQDIKKLEKKIAASLSQIAMNEQLAGKNVDQLDMALSSQAYTGSYLGITLRADQETGNIFIGQVADSGFGKTVGVEPGDQLLSFNGLLLTKNNVSQLPALINSFADNEKVVLGISRNGHAKLLSGEVEKLNVPGFALKTNSSATLPSSLSSLEEMHMKLGLNYTTFMVDRSDYPYSSFIPLHTLPACDTDECVAVYKKYKGYANKEFILAQIRKAEFLLTGFGVEKDEDKAYRLFKRLANKKIPHAQFMVAKLIQQEQPKDSRVTKYLEKAAKAGHQLASLALAEHYLAEDNFEKADQYLAKPFKKNVAAALVSVYKLRADNNQVIAKLPQVNKVISDKDLHSLESIVQQHGKALAKIETIPNLKDLVAFESKALKQAAYTHSHQNRISVMGRSGDINKGYNNHENNVARPAPANNGSTNQ